MAEPDRPTQHRWMDVDQRNLFLMAVLGLQAYRRHAEVLRSAAVEPTRESEGDAEIALAVLGALRLDARLSAALDPLFTPPPEPSAPEDIPRPDLRALLR